MARDLSVYWVVIVSMRAEKVRIDDSLEAAVIPAYEKRFEFRGDDAEREARDCRRQAKAAGFDTRIAKAKAVSGSWEPVA